MADPNPKRVKMDNPNQQSSSTSPKDRKFRLINPNTQSFEEIRNMPGFVDHTHFIQSFLLEKSKLAICAPRRFGKSSHLDMVHEFLQIDVDKITGEVQSSVDGPAEGRKNYKLFEGTRIITDDNNKDLVEDHLGKHPVIHLDFKISKSICSVEQTMMHCRLVMHEAYKNHSYLITSTKLVPGNEKCNASAQLICERWCDDDQYLMLEEPVLFASLYNLTEYLYNHFNRKVYILVDEFDAINARALFSICDNNVEKLRSICEIITNLLESVLKGKKADSLVAGAILTGVSYISGLGYSKGLNNLTVMRFLEDTKIFSTDKDFVPFYGATREEVESLIQKLVKNKELVAFEGKKEFLNDTNELDVKKIMADVQARYNGYFNSKGIRIFCLWSVLQYLDSGNPENYWNQTDGIDTLYMILQCGKVASEIIKLMRWETIKFKRLDKIMIHSLVKLHDLLDQKNVEVNSEVVFNFLLDQGYLTYPEGGAQDGNFKLPNAEIRASLSNMIGNIVKEHWYIDTTSCTSLINDISLSLMDDEKALQKRMLEVYEAISSILSSLEQTNRAFVNESRMLCTMYKALDDAKSFDLCVDLQIKDTEAEGRSITSYRPDFLQLHKNDKKCSILWELKYNSSKNDIYTTSLYALQEARGIVNTKNGRTKKYMDSLKKLGREALVIGLSLDSDIKVSLSYALNMDEKIFFKSETESTSFPRLYQTYNPVPLEENDD